MGEALPKDPVIDHYARNVEYDIQEDGVIVRCFGRAMGYLSEGQFKYVDPFWGEVFSRHLELTPDVQEKTEKHYRDEVIRKLSGEGWRVESEVYTPYGRIDILAEQGDRTIIVEVKLRGDNNSTAHALGQLLFYQRTFPGAELFIATATEPSDGTMAILGEYGVNQL